MPAPSKTPRGVLPSTVALTLLTMVRDVKGWPTTTKPKDSDSFLVGVAGKTFNVTVTDVTEE